MQNKILTKILVFLTAASMTSANIVPSPVFAAARDNGVSRNKNLKQEAPLGATAVKTTLEKEVPADNGNGYSVKVTYYANSGILERAELEVTELLPNEREGKPGSSEPNTDYEEYVARAENALGMEEGTARYVRLFDLKIRGLSGQTITVTEEGAEGYTTTAEAKNGSYDEALRSYTLTIPEEGDTVAFTNTDDTGSLITGGPGRHGIYLIGIALFIVELLFVAKKRRMASITQHPRIPGL